MPVEGRRQFIPREAGDPDLTQSELDAQKDSENVKLSKFIKTAAFATALGAAALSPEVAHSQQPELERQNIEQIQIRITEETRFERCVSAMSEAYPVLKSLLKGARVEEAGAESETEKSERTFYVYLPLKARILAVKIDVAQLERADGDLGEHQFAVGLERAMRDNGLIEFVKSPDGTISPIPNALEAPSSHLLHIVKDEIHRSNLLGVNEYLPKIISELQKRESVIATLDKSAAEHRQLPTPAQEEYPALGTVDMNVPNISNAGDALVRRIDLAMERRDFQALRSLSSIIRELQTSLQFSQGLVKSDRQ